MFETKDYFGYVEYADRIRKMIHPYVEKCLEEGIFHDLDAMPILFMFRHCLELYIKGLNYQLKKMGEASYTPNHKHDILIPFSELLKNKRIRRDSTIEEFVRQIGTLDKDGQKFRYPEDKTGKIFEESIKFSQEIKKSDNTTLEMILKTLDYFENVSGDLEYLEYTKYMEHDSDP
jgi:hypothetical protein